MLVSNANSAVGLSYSKLGSSQNKPTGPFSSPTGTPRYFAPRSKGHQSPDATSSHSRWNTASEPTPRASSPADSSNEKRDHQPKKRSPRDSSTAPRARSSP